MRHKTISTFCTIPKYLTMTVLLISMKEQNTRREEQQIDGIYGISDGGWSARVFLFVHFVVVAVVVPFFPGLAHHFSKSNPISRKRRTESDSSSFCSFFFLLYRNANTCPFTQRCNAMKSSFLVAKHCSSEGKRNVPCSSL